MIDEISTAMGSEWSRGRRTIGTPWLWELGGGASCGFGVVRMGGFAVKCAGSLRQTVVGTALYLRLVSNRQQSGRRVRWNQYLDRRRSILVAYIR